MGEAALVEITMRTRPLDRELGGQGMLAVGNGLERFVVNPVSARLFTGVGDLLGTTRDDPIALGERVETGITDIARRIYTDRSGDECFVDGVRYATFDLLCAKADADRARVASATADGQSYEVTSAVGLVQHLYQLARQEHALECLLEPITLRYIDIYGRRSMLMGTLHRVTPFTREELAVRDLTEWARGFGVGDDSIAR